MGECRVDVVLFDFGGVVAEEGFVNGLRAIGRLNGLNPDDMVKEGFDCVHETGYVVGRSDENTFWQLLRQRSGIQGDTLALRQEILSRFTIRMWMIEVIKQLRLSRVQVGMLSDQTNWIDELNDRYDFFKWFDPIFISYHTGKSKRDPSLFDEVVEGMNVKAERVLFVDDHEENCKRARQRALQAIHFRDEVQFLNELENYCPFLDTHLCNTFI